MTRTDPLPDTTAEPAEPGRNRWRAWPHVLVLACYVGLAVWVTSGLWAAPDTRVLTDNPNDQPLMEWMLAYGAHAVTHLTNPFFTTQVNAPDGANLMANSSVILPAAVLTPVTVAFGPAVSFVVLEGVALAGTAAGWYLVFCRRLVRSRAAAAIGAGFIGFAPGMISMSNAHVHITGQFLVPFVVLCVLPSPGGPRPARRGVVLGALLAAQFLTGTEVLLFTVLGVAVFVVAWALLNRAAARRELRGFLIRIGVAAPVFLVLAGYPLWMLLAGPQSYHGSPWNIGKYGTDVLSWVWYGTYSPFGGHRQAARVYAGNVTEEATYLGVGLVVLAVALVWWLRRSRTVLALTCTGVLFALLSLGTEVVFLRRHTGIPGPWALVAGLPLVDQAIPDRLALVTTTALGAVLALGAERALRTRVPRPVWIGVFVAALLPLVPLALPTTSRPAVPAFFTDGYWRAHVAPGRTVLAVPQFSYSSRLGMRFAAYTRADMAIPGGPVMHPGPDGRAQWATPRSPFAVTVANVSVTGRIPPVDAADRARARRDLAAGHTDLVVLDPSARYQTQVRTAVDRLLAVPGRHQGGVWYWSVPG